jgi:hypothetical protein
MFSLLSKKLFALVSFLLISILLSGCGVWRNFTTYFNTYYNAKTLFDQTEESILKQRKDIFQFRPDQQNNLQQGQYNSSQYNSTQYGTNQYNANQNTTGNQYGQQQQYGTNQYGSQQQSGQFANQSGALASGNVTQDLTRVIEKCSKILQYENKSGYFPDALFIAGKALYYQEEYSKAQRKFKELGGLGTTSYTLINKLWLAKTDLQLFEIEEGLKLIDEVREEALEANEKDIYTDATVLKISFFIYREEYTKAAGECKAFLENSKDDEMKAMVAFQMGKIYQRMGDEQNALLTYGEVLKYDPTPDVELKSQLEHAKLLKSLNKIEESQRELEDLRDQGKFKNNLDEIYLELGDIYIAQDEVKKGIDLFKIVDTTYKLLPTGGQASLKLADVYKNKVRDLDSAQKYFNRITTAFLPNDVKKAADITAKNIVRYFGYKDENEKLTKKLSYIEDPSRYIRDSIDYDIATKEVIEEGRILMEKQNNQNSQSNSTDLSAQRSTQPKLTQDQLLQQQQQLLLIEKQKEKLKNPNVGQQRAVPLKDLIILGKASKPERLKATPDSAKQLIALNLFNQGSLFFSELDYPDSALIYFKNILDNYNSKQVIPQTLYSLGTYYETHKDSAKADSLFKTIYDKYPNDKLWEPASRKLGLIKKEDKKAMVSSADSAEVPYRLAEHLYFEKKYNEAVDSFYNIYKRFPKSVFAPKALYFAGIIYEENLKNNDSAAVAYGIISEKYPTDIISQRVSGIYLVYKGEKDRVKREAEAKLKEEESKRKEVENKLKAEQDKNVPADPTGITTQPVPAAEVVPPESTKPQPEIKDSTRIKLRKILE